VKGQYSGVSFPLCGERIRKNVSSIKYFQAYYCYLLTFFTFSKQSKEEKYFIHNHLSFLVKYHRDEQKDLMRIVGFEVKPFRYTVIFHVCNSAATAGSSIRAVVLDACSIS
jgi:Endomembrane protein 70